MKKYRPQKMFTTLHAAAYRLSRGKIGGKMGRFNVALLTTTGRKSGKKVTCPLGYFERPDGYVVIASNGGAPKHPSWYHNLTSDPQAVFQAMEKVVPVTAEVLTGEERANVWRDVVAAVPMYAEYQKETEREIPLVLLKPTENK
ncbi:MAG: nitroreductase family deazaflavin-dependent oxidoreductase [Anaerolineales bacterium]|nr:nitroreductase family deazaflavin-dependent oxidoreductase [Anaerolineales bacterium]